jgi:beta-glucosidase
MTTRFPQGFLWGCATSAYQVEGSSLADGAGPSIWQRFSHTPNRVTDGDTGDIACDHYRRYESDVDLMHTLGMQSYRFSIAWSRVLPEGTGRVNQAGLDFYDRLVDRLLSRGIQPNVTLYHWDLPAALDNRGGWLNRDIANWFADYTQIVVRKLDDRVKLWVTLNEPWVVADGGYMYGVLAPGHRNPYEAPLASHNLMRAHAAGVDAYRAIGKHQIGLVVNLEPKYPASQSREDLAAARRAEAYMNRQYLDPALKGSYPPEMTEIFGDAWSQWPDSDVAALKRKVDFLGINYYTRSVQKADANAWPLYATPVRQKQHTYSETGWEVYPQALTDVLVWVKNQYGNPPIYITENGAAFFDPPHSINGRIHDPLRTEYLRTHIRAVHDAITQGVDMRGYFVWSFLDNFEWAHGFSKRFGIVHVNYGTMERTPKQSAAFYSDVIATNGAAALE